MTLPQGDIRLLDDPIARALLASTELARLAYVATDGTPRVVPMLFYWTGTELVLPTFTVSLKLAALRRNPAIAVIIDAAGPPPRSLSLRGEVEITDFAGIVPEYAEAQRRYYGDAGAVAVEHVRSTGAAMTRIALRPTWAGVLDFTTRFPGALTAAGVA